MSPQEKFQRFVAQYPHPRRPLYARPGSWNDPDMRYVGAGEFDGDHLVEARAHFALWAMLNAPLMIGYPFALPPGVPADRVATMQKGFQDTMNDPEFQSEMIKQKLEFMPKDG